MKEASALYRLLGDDARLRLLRVLARDRFNVKELTGILGLAQSGVSRHLGLLKEAGLIGEERDGAFTYYRLSPSLRAEGNALWPLLQAQFDEAAGAAALKADEARLQEVLRLRRENFDRHSGPDTRMAGSWSPAGAGPPGPAPSACCCRPWTWPTWAAARATSRSRPRCGRTR